MMQTLLQLRHQRINKETKEFAVMSFLSQLHLAGNELYNVKIFLKHFFS